ncbi:membrane protein [Bacteroidia bacterium]|nr:membrane protein [Bacteroidia bacterium]
MERENRLLQTIIEGFKDIFYIWKEELRNVFRDQGVVIFFFLVPIAYPIVYAFIYNHEVVRDAKLAVVDQSDTYLSREFTRRINATADVQVTGVYSDMEEAKRALDRKEAYGILYFPPEFSKDLHTGKQTTVSLYSDMISMLYYKAFLVSSTNISLEMGKELRQRNDPASTAELQNILVNPVPYEEVAMYNPQSGFATFLIPAILILVIQQTLVLGICMLGGTARERSPIHNIFPPSLHYQGTLRIVLGKSLVYLMLYSIAGLWVLGIIPRLFEFPQIGNPVTILWFTIPFLLACIFMAMTLSGFMTSRESPMLVFVFASVILLFLSGISWPKEAMPTFWKTISHLVPSTPGIRGFVRINMAGATLNEVAYEYQMLWVQTGVYFVTTFFVYRNQIIRAQRYSAD